MIFWGLSLGYRMLLASYMVKLGLLSVCTLGVCVVL